MDPNTTLYTFMLETEPSVQSVHLVGSWDNFSSFYSLERDLRRGCGQWKGCYSFKDIVCDDGRLDQSRSGGLKMGSTYYYYYEVDRSIETFDPTKPTTTACPFMPGQAVNTLEIPAERTLRRRRASMNSMRDEELKTMDPEAKYQNPKPLASALSALENRRVATATSILRNRSSSRSSSPVPSWRYLFNRRTISLDSKRKRSRSLHRSDDEDIWSITAYDRVVSFPMSSRANAAATMTRTTRDGRRSRTMSPDTLRRFLSDDAASALESEAATRRPSLIIPEDAADLEDETDDENFATSAISETQAFTTRLSPPPAQRASTSESTRVVDMTSSFLDLGHSNSSFVTLVPDKSCNEPASEARDLSGSSFFDCSDVLLSPAPMTLPKLMSPAYSRWSISAAEGAPSPTSNYLDDEAMTFYYDSNDDEEDEDFFSSNGEPTIPYFTAASAIDEKRSFEGYSLPRESEEGKSILKSPISVRDLDSPKLVSGGETVIPERGPNFLDTTIDSGLDEFVSELGWIVEVISTNDH